MWFFRSPLRTALFAQLLGSLIAWAVIHLGYPRLFEFPLAAAAVQGICAAYVSRKLEAPTWWLPMHLVFAPLVVAISALHIPPGFWLAAFVVALLVFWRTDRSQVPLYLSNAVTAAAVIRLIPAQPCAMVDLGCGTGGLLRQLALARPDCHFLGIEHAPLPWLWAWWRTRGLANAQVRYGDFWSQDLKDYALVYAFLSPVPMARLWTKARTEMGPEALLVSNSFAVPEVEASRVIDVDDARQTRLLCYLPGQPGAAGAGAI